MMVLSGGLAAQDRSQSRGSDDGWIAALLHMRQELRLSPEQITQLRRIDSETEELNRPMVASLRQIRSRVRSLGPMDQFTPEKRAQFNAYLAQGRPHIDKIHENNFAAMRKVGEVLSNWQKERMRELLNNANVNRERSSNNPPSHGRGQ